MQKLLFIDRDGTLIDEPDSDFQIDTLPKFRLLPDVVNALKRIVDRSDYKIVMVTNQDGLGTSSFPEERFWPYQNLLIQVLESQGVVFDAVYIDRSLPSENSPNRKPQAGMLTQYFNGKYNLDASYVIGDRLSDVQLANNIGARSIYYRGEPSNDLGSIPDLITDSWNVIADFLLLKDRKADVFRSTRETQIRIELNIDKTAPPEIDTGIGFFDHMLEQIGTHSGVSLNVKCVGDLMVDEHHTIEDVGLVLGDAFSQAMGNKRGINRYGFYVPMDESLAYVVLDFSGRPYLQWDVDFICKSVGGIDITMFEHFFQSFCQKAQCTLHIKANGQNTHHLIEAVFKAFARAIRIAVSESGDDVLPSSKGLI